MRLEHHLVGGYVHYISPHIIILLLRAKINSTQVLKPFYDCKGQNQSKFWYTCQGISKSNTVKRYVQ